VREILVVHSNRIGAELLRRADDGNWPAGPETLQADATLVLPSIDFRAPLADFYQQTHLARSKKQA
jgi:hypothetical protein